MKCNIYETYDKELIKFKRKIRKYLICDDIVSIHAGVFEVNKMTLTTYKFKSKHSKHVSILISSNINNPCDHEKIVKDFISYSKIYTNMRKRYMFIVFKLDKIVKFINAPYPIGVL